MRVGTAGWTLPAQWQENFPVTGSHLERYAARFSCTEINSSFYRQHKPSTYGRWAESVPEDFRFSVKIPRAITHDQALIAADILLEVFLDEVTALGDRLGALLVQLPPSLAFDGTRADDFFGLLRSMYGGGVVCEPRHASWFGAEANGLLLHHRVARVAADPACVPAAMAPGGWPGMQYTRLHGSPRMYYSPYPVSFLDRMAAAVDASVEQWCIFDNTASNAAVGDALSLSTRLRQGL